MLHQRFGRLSWAALFETAIELADKGFALSAGLVRATKSYRKQLEQGPGN